MQCINVFYRFGARVHLAGTHRLTLANQTIRCSAGLSNINVTASLYCNRYYSSHSHLTGGACNYQIVNFPHDQLVFGRCSNLQLQPVRFAGHSHWKNIKSTKEAKDSLKQRTYLDVCRRIKIAVQEGGGSTNPKLNALLARVIEDGKAKDVSSATMMEALKRLEKAKDKKGGIVFFEARCLGGCVVVEVLTERPKWARQEVQNRVKKFGGSIGDAGIAMHSFNCKGVVYVPMATDTDLGQPSTVLTADKAFELAIEAGAEEVMEGYDEYEQRVYMFICEPKQLHVVKKALQELSFKPSEARIEYVPHTFVTLDSSQTELASQMIEHIKTCEDVVQIYHNIQFS